MKHWTSRSPDGQILREFEVTGNGGSWAHVRDYVYGAEGIVGTVERDGGQRYLHTDHLGTTRLLTTSAGTALKTRHYYPFGFEATADPPGTILLDGFESGDLLGWQVGKDVLAIKFTGHQRELHGNSDYMLGRHYLALANRFASVDPARDGWNLYAYVGNDPIAYADPSGYARTAASIANDFNARLHSLKDETAYSASDGSLVGVAKATAWGAGFDFAIGFVDLFTVGADTGTAIGSGAGALDVTMAVAQDTLRLGAMVAPLAGGLRGGAARATSRTGGAAPVRIGQAGEDAVRAAFDIGPKVPIRVAGRGRIPDGLNLTTRTLSEVKNVKSLSFTQQLRDFSTYAKGNNLSFDLYVRSTTKLSGPLRDAIKSGSINLRFIP